MKDSKPPRWCVSLVFEKMTWNEEAGAYTAAEIDNQIPLVIREKRQDVKAYIMDAMMHLEAEL